VFKLKYPVVDIQLTKFQILKPWFIRRLTTWNTCCCRYHTELGMLLIALNDLQKDLHGIHANCLCICNQVCIESSNHGCMACTSQFSGLIALWSSVLCPIRPLHLWHKRECLLGEYSHCGANTLKICPIELKSTDIVPWKSIGSEIVGQTEDGKDKKVPKVVYNETMPKELF
jgi:hypothetical protein